MTWTTTQYNTYKNGYQSEHDIQSRCVRWFRQHYPQKARLLIAIPNGADLGGKDRIARAKNWQKLEAEGAVKGAADLFLSIPSGDLHGLYIEMKTPKGRQSPDQKQFEMSVIYGGYGYALPRSFDEFERVIRRYLEFGEY